MNIFKFEEIKSGFTRQTKQQRSSVFFETDSVNKVQSVYLKISRNKKWNKSARLLSREDWSLKEAFSERLYGFIYWKNIGTLWENWGNRNCSLIGHSCLVDLAVDLNISRWLLNGTQRQEWGKVWVVHYFTSHDNKMFISTGIWWCKGSSTYGCYSLHTLFDVATTACMHCMPVYNTIVL